MIHITLGPEKIKDPAEDELGRDRVGYSPTMSPLALYDAAHGCWVLGERAQRERFALFSFGGIVRQAVEIEGIEQVTDRAADDARDNRSVIHGKVLGPGDNVYDAYVDKPSPVQGVRNPVTYVSSPATAHPCRCGCGGSVTDKDFLPGHDQTALHDRVRQIGTVADFLVWFDVVRGAKTC